MSHLLDCLHFVAAARAEAIELPPSQERHVHRQARNACCSAT